MAVFVENRCAVDRDELREAMRFELEADDPSWPRIEELLMRMRSRVQGPHDDLEREAYQDLYANARAQVAAWMVTRRRTRAVLERVLELRAQVPEERELVVGQVAGVDWAVAGAAGAAATPPAGAIGSYIDDFGRVPPEAWREGVIERGAHPSCRTVLSAQDFDARMREVGVPWEAGAELPAPGWVFHQGMAAPLEYFGPVAPVALDERPAAQSHPDFAGAAAGWGPGYWISDDLLRVHGAAAPAHAIFDSMRLAYWIPEAPPEARADG
jgi:hypothetical protein